MIGRTLKSETGKTQFAVGLTDDDLITMLGGQVVVLENAGGKVVIFTGESNQDLELKFLELISQKSEED